LRTNQKHDKKTDGASNEKTHCCHGEGVSKVNDGIGGSIHLCLVVIIVNAIDEKVEGRTASRQERPPPPMIVLSTKMEIAEQDGRLAYSDDKDCKDEHEKTEHVVEMVTPKTVQNEVQLDENASKRQNAAHEDRR